MRMLFNGTAATRLCCRQCPPSAASRLVPLVPRLTDVVVGATALFRALETTGESCSNVECLPARFTRDPVEERRPLIAARTNAVREPACVALAPQYKS